MCGCSYSYCRSYCLLNIAGFTRFCHLSFTLLKCSCSCVCESPLRQYETSVVSEYFTGILYNSLHGVQSTVSRDAILAINNSRCRATLDRETRDVICRLQLCRRGCRSGEHRRRKEAAASTVTSSACCAAEILTILGNRRFVNNNNNVNQLFSRRRNEY